VGVGSEGRRRKASAKRIGCFAVQAGNAPALAMNIQGQEDGRAAFGKGLVSRCTECAVHISERHYPMLAAGHDRALKFSLLNGH